MKVISVINYKGGVGKTTITANLAADLVARANRRVLVIDLDPQTNLTFSFMPVEVWHDKYAEKGTIRNWFDSIINDEPVPPLSSLIVKKQGVDIICSHLGLIDVDIELAAKIAATTTRQHKINFVKIYSHIKKALEKMDADYDVVLFDCPPNFSTVTRNAIIASDFYLVPAKMDYLSTLGIEQLQHRVNEFTKEYNSFRTTDTDCDEVLPQFLGVVATMVSFHSGSPIKAQLSYINRLRKKVTVFDSMIRDNKTLYADAPEHSEPVVLETHSGKTYSEVVDELKRLTDEFIDKTRV